MVMRITMRMAHTVTVLGAAGYSGVELLKLLAVHPGVRIVAAASDKHAGKPTSTLTGLPGDLAFVPTAQALATPADVALLAVPHAAALELAAAVRAPRVVDLSNAHRATHPYGLTSLFADELAGARLIANPGCYATCVITAVAPLVRHGLVDGDVYVAAGSGVTGAGRTAEEAMSLGELYGDVRAYKVLRHQHVPEIEATLARLGAGPRVVLTTHLLPVARGIFATLNVRLRTAMTSEALTERMRADWAGEPTVTVMATPEDVSLRKVVGTNQVLVGAAVHGTTAVITASIDNLLKGAAGQAVENMNLVLGQPRTLGLDHLARHA